MERDFVLAAGVDAGVVQINEAGAQLVQLDGHGNLLLSVAGKTVRELAPVIYQDGPSGRQPVTGRYVLEGGTRVGFQVGTHDTSKPLVIDPTTDYSTYLGGNGADSGNAIAVDGAGNAHVTGQTSSTNFPTAPNPYQSGLAGSGPNAFITRFNANGALVYSTYLGGTGNDSGNGIAVDMAQNAYITGSTSSTDFPTSSGALQTVNKATPGSTNAFVSNLDSTGTTLIYSTYLGGTSNPTSQIGDSGNGITIDSSGAYVTGSTGSSDFPSQNPFQSVNRSSQGTNAFVSKLKPDGSGLLYSSYLGGTLPLATDSGKGIAVDISGHAYITGVTNSNGFPTLSAYQPSKRGPSNAFVTRLDPIGTLAYSTYLGGSGRDSGNGIAVSGGTAYITGSTKSTDFPTTSHAYQSWNRGSANSVSNAFVTRLNGSGSGLIYSSYLGGSGAAGSPPAGDSGNGIALDARQGVYATGTTNSNDFPTLNPHQQNSGGSSDAFVWKSSGIPVVAQLLDTVEGQALPDNTVVGEFTVLPGQFVPPYTATIDWGDGTPTSQGTVTIDASGNGTITAGHTYDEEQAGPYTFFVTLTDSQGLSGTAAGSAWVRDAPLTANPGVVTLANVAAGAATGLVTLAYFTDGAGAPRFADYTMQPLPTNVDWGDGSQLDHPTPVAGSGNTALVQGNHTYNRPGRYTIRIDITDDATVAATPIAKITVTGGPGTLIGPAGSRSEDGSDGSDGSGSAAPFGLPGVDPPYSPTGSAPVANLTGPAPDLIPLGEASVSANTGGVQISIPLDFDLSPGTAVGGTPALVYNSDTVSVQPILLFVWTSGGTVPSDIQVQLTWDNGTPQPWVTFPTTNHNPNDSYLLGVQVASSGTATRLYTRRGPS